MQNYTKYIKANQELWDEWTEIHVKSRFYDVEGFKAGKLALDPIEEEELTDVEGKTLLHLQCHFGMTTMSWARKGAIATGMDFSEKAIKYARELNDELGLNCKFVQSDIYDLKNNLDGQFDIVFTSYGVLGWLPDIKGWAETVAHFLKAGGTFFIAEIHPISSMFEDKSGDNDLKLKYPYFHTEDPIKFDTEGSYVDRTAEMKTEKEYEWFHSLSDVVNALIQAGLKIEYLNEYDYTVYQQFAFLKKEGRKYLMPDGMPKPPLLFSIKATK
jgi:2-polyprenyl-3-methyl-5-hydroxy-6-metoxy-1,4-benzoquinol methylase